MENSEGTIILKAEFNSVLKTYILLYVGFILVTTIIGIPLAIVWFCGLGQWYSKHYYEKLECVITDKNIKFKKGIILQFEKTIPLENIQDMSFIEGPLLRRFNLCVLKIETAGGSANNSNHMSLVGIKDAPNFRRKVLEYRTLLKQLQSSATDQNLLVEIKNSLHRIEGLLKDNKK